MFTCVGQVISSSLLTRALLLGKEASFLRLGQYRLGHFDTLAWLQ